jgi:hypothetical protein
MDAKPQCRQIDETLLRRTAGPYIWINGKVICKGAAGIVGLCMRR